MIPMGVSETMRPISIAPGKTPDPHEMFEIWNPKNFLQRTFFHVIFNGDLIRFDYVF